MATNGGSLTAGISQSTGYIPRVLLHQRVCFTRGLASLNLLKTHPCMSAKQGANADSKRVASYVTVCGIKNDVSPIVRVIVKKSKAFIILLYISSIHESIIFCWSQLAVCDYRPAESTSSRKLSTPGLNNGFGIAYSDLVLLWMKRSTNVKC